MEKTIYDYYINNDFNCAETTIREANFEFLKEYIESIENIDNNR